MSVRWGTTEELASSLGYSVPEIQIRLIHHRLLDQFYQPSEKALQDSLVKIIHPWPRCLRKPRLLWDLPQLWAMLSFDPVVKEQQEFYIRQGIEVCTEAYIMAEAGYKEKAEELEKAFWRRVPYGFRLYVRQRTQEAMVRALPVVTRTLLENARAESEKSAEILEITPFRKMGKENLLAEIQSHCTQESVLTLNMGGRTALTTTMRKTEEGCNIGKDETERTKFLESLDFAVILLEHVSLPEEDPTSGKPIVEVRGYQVGSNTRGFFYKKMDPNHLKENYETNLEGENHPLEPWVRYR